MIAIGYTLLFFEQAQVGKVFHNSMYEVPDIAFSALQNVLNLAITAALI
jgi:hypothetical protein